MFCLLLVTHEGGQSCPASLESQMLETTHIQRTSSSHLAERLTHPLVQKAARQAASDFEGVFRKVPSGSDIIPAPYYSHLHRVAILLAEAGYGPEVIAAGYLHDHLEDLPREWNLNRLEVEFGEKVAALVSWVTHQSSAAGWEERTEAYARRIADAPHEALAISAADKLSNIEDSVILLRLGYPVESFIKKGWQPNSDKFHRLLAIFRTGVAPHLLENLSSALIDFDRLGQALQNGCNERFGGR
jgi:hypothetical protein